MVQRPFLFLAFCLSVLFILPAEAQVPERSLIFLQEDASPKIKKLIQELYDSLKIDNIEVEFIELKEGQALPEEINFTPFIVYQSHRGLAIYQGRYTTINRVRNFIRLQRKNYIAPKPYSRPRMFHKKEGEMPLYIETKITRLQGQGADAIDSASFYQDAWATLEKELKDFELLDTALISPSALKFYFDYHPYLGEDGKTYINYELFSHYDCITPIAKSSNEKPIKHKKADKAFAKAAKELRKKLYEQLQNSELGDAHRAVATNTTRISWEEFGYPFPKREKYQRLEKEISPDIELPRSWVIDRPKDPLSPLANFHFPPPLQQYAGELRRLEGNILLGENRELKTATGAFSVDLSSLTMGIPELDTALYQKMFYLDKFPQATLKIINVTGDNGPINWGSFRIVQITGEIEFKGKKAEILMPCQWEALLDENKKLRLHVSGFFKLDGLNDVFGMENPPGPTSANNSLVFHFNLLLKPSDEE